MKSIINTFYRDSYEIFALMFRCRLLIRELTFREISDRYTGQVFGSLWAIIHPLSIIAVFLFLFGRVFQAKVGIDVDIPSNHTIYILSGLIPWLVIADVLSRSSMIIVSQSSLVKQVVFPIEVLPIKVVLGSLIPIILGQIILGAYTFFLYNHLPWTYFLFLPTLFLFVFFLIGISYFLSAISVFFRDVKDFIQLFVFLGLYLSPIVYDINWVPSSLRIVIYLNPFTYPILCFQDIAYNGNINNPLAWSMMVIITISCFMISSSLFKRLKVYFGNYL